MESSDKPYLPIRLLATVSMLTAMELALAAVESLFSPLIPFPGVKLGLANIVTLVAFTIIKRRQVFLVVGMRLALAGLVLGTFLTPTFWISCGGGLLSFLAMAACYGRRHISIVGISLAGAAVHNMGQLIVVSFLMANRAIFYYLPWLLIWSVPMGLFTGLAAKSAIRALDGLGIHAKK